MNFKLTFNRPAVRQFIEGGEGRGLKIKVENGIVMFTPSATRNGDDVASLTPRTRGGYESIVEGSGAKEVFNHLQNPHGPFFVLRRVGKDWVAAEPYKGKDAPPKFEPHVRVWHSSQPKTSVKAVAPKRAAAAPKAETAPVPVDIADRVRWAYSKLTEERRPGRPSREISEARQVKDSFESAAMEFLSNMGGKGIDVKSAVEAYRNLGAFLRTVAPEALHETPVETKTPTPTKVKVAREAKAPKAVRQTKAPKVVARANDDEEAERQRREASRALGLDEKPAPVSKRIRGPVNTRAFGGERLIA